MSIKILVMSLLIMSVKLLFILFNLNHLLMMMLMFEFMGLKVLFFLMLSIYSNKIYLSLIFLVFLACEASIGLSLLVGVVRCNYLTYVENSFIYII